MGSSMSKTDRALVSSLQAHSKRSDRFVVITDRPTLSDKVVDVIHKRNWYLQEAIYSQDTSPPQYAHLIMYRVGRLTSADQVQTQNL